MELNLQNDDETSLVVVGDEDGIIKYEISKNQPDELFPTSSVKIEPIEDVKDNYCTEDGSKIIPIALDHGEINEADDKPDIEVLDEESLSQEQCLEQFIKDDVDIKKIQSNVPRKERALRKKHHEYLLDEAEYPKHNNSNNKKRKTKDSPKQPVSKKEPISDEEEFFEVEFLDDDFDSPEVLKKIPVPNKDLNEIKFLDDSLLKMKRKENVTPKKHTLKKTPITDEEFLEIEYLDGYPNTRKEGLPKKQVQKTEEDEEYLPEDDNQEEFIKEEYILPKKLKGKTNIPLRKAAEKVKTAGRPIKSFIAELWEKWPLYKENKEELVEYLANLMKERKPPPPLPNSYLLKDDNEYSCSYCDVDSPTEAAAGRHYQHSHGPRYLVCYACGDDFRSTANLYKHEKRCRAPDAEIQLRARGVFLGCKGRGRPYLTNNKFVAMKPARRQANPVPVVKVEKTNFNCPLCPAVYERNSSFKEHMHKHTGFRPFQCKECLASYVSRHQLHRHAKKHSNEQFICDHCGKVLKVKSHLVSHMDTHLPRLRFGCSRCGRRYAKRGEVRSHILRDHMNLPPPAACPVCPKRYNRMSHVKAHMKKDHGLILMTKNAIIRNLPYLRMENLQGAKIVFNSNKDSTEVLINTKEILKS